VNQGTRVGTIPEDKMQTWPMLLSEGISGSYLFVSLVQSCFIF